MQNPSGIDSVVARELTDPERREIWPRLLAHDAMRGAYQSCTERYARSSPSNGYRVKDLPDPKVQAEPLGIAAADHQGSRGGSGARQVAARRSRALVSGGHDLMGEVVLGLSDRDDRRCCCLSAGSSCLSVGSSPKTRARWPNKQVIAPRTGLKRRADIRSGCSGTDSRLVKLGVAADPRGEAEESLSPELTLAVSGSHRRHRQDTQCPVMVPPAVLQIWGWPLGTCRAPGS
jgi:hypothetical protein